MIKIYPASLEWMEIRPQLLGYLRQHEAERIKQQYPSTIHNRFILLSNEMQHHQELLNGTSLEVRPRIIDICLLPSVQTIMERYPNMELTSSVLTRTLKPVLHKSIEKWSANAVNEVKGLAREQLGLRPGVDPSRHISVIFQCETCHKMLRFDEALTHPHFSEDTTPDCRRTPTRKIRDKAPEGLSSYEQLARAFFRSLPWDCSALRADAASFLRINNLVTVLGYNPATVTYDDLLLSDVKVTCNSCRSSRRMVMDIPTAVRFSLPSLILLSYR
jgi:hypothetical protein